MTKRSEHERNGDWGYVSLREYIEDQFKARDLALVEARKVIDGRLEQMNELREQINTERGLYATTEMVNQNRDAIETIRRDHVQRTEFDTIADRVTAAEGRRSLLVGITATVVTVVVAISGILYGSINASIPSHSEISAQIATEAPWVQDRPKIEGRLDALERQVEVNTKRLNRIESLDAFFCKTRQTANLPGCTP